MRARVALHGFAINCDIDLSWFQGIVACGLPNHGVTSLSEIAGREVSVNEMLPIIERHLAEVFQLELSLAPPEAAGMFRPLQAVSGVMTVSPATRTTSLKPRPDPQALTS